MGCGCGSSSSSSQPVLTSNKNRIEPIENCDITHENLITWKNFLTCIKTNNYFTKAKIDKTTVNQFLGIVQSGLNYPTNYCYFYEQLDFFRTNILPNLITNVSECIYQ